MPTAHDASPQWLSSPEGFYPVAGRLVRWSGWTAVVLVAIGLYVGFLRTPTHLPQGEAHRIAFVHLPASWMSIGMYAAMAACGALGLARGAALPTTMARALAPTGALFTCVSLWTGVLLGKPASGAWWDWNARLTSELILLFMYLGVMSLHGVIGDDRRADRAAALLALTGALNVPVVFVAIDWWNALHRPAAVALAAPATSPVTSAGMVAMAAGFAAYAIGASMSRLRSIVLEREQLGALVTGERG